MKNGTYLSAMLREFPLVVAADTSHEGGHWFVGTPGLLLEIYCFLGFTLGAPKLVRYRHRGVDEEGAALRLYRMHFFLCNL